MPEVICNTSPIQYLYQLGLLHVLEQLTKRVTVPPAVVDELAAGRAAGVNLPDLSVLPWVSVKAPASAAVLPLVTDLGPGETEVLALALEMRDAVAVIDDGLARRVAQTLHIRFTGTLGLLLDAKRAGLLPAVALVLDQLDTLGFRVAASTRAAVLELAGEGAEV